MFFASTVFIFFFIETLIINQSLIHQQSPFPQPIRISQDDVMISVVENKLLLSVLCNIVFYFNKN